MESDDTAALRRRFLEALAAATPPLHAKDLRVAGLDRRTVQKRLERLRRSATPGAIAGDAEVIRFARHELFRAGDPVARGLSHLQLLGSPAAVAFARRAGLQTLVVGDWVELAHSPGDQGWTREQVHVGQLARGTLFARGRTQGWLDEKKRYLREVWPRRNDDPELRRNLTPNRLKMDLAGLRARGTGDAPLCAIEVAEVDWLTGYCLNRRLDEVSTGGGTIRERWGEPVAVAERRGLPGMLVAHVLVLTGDGRFLACRRQPMGIEDEPGTWSLSIEERWDATRREAAHGDRTPHDVVRRAVREELGLAVVDENVRVLAWGLEVSVLYPGFIALARVAAPSWEIEDRRAHAGDANELTYVTSLPARLASAGLLLQERFAPPDRPELDAPWHRTARARLFTTIAHLGATGGRDGRSRVLAQLGP